MHSEPIQSLAKKTRKFAISNLEGKKCQGGDFGGPYLTTNCEIAYSAQKSPNWRFLVQKIAKLATFSTF